MNKALIQSIKLAPAQNIFEAYNIDEIKVSGKVVGYHADVFGKRLEATGLTQLCINIVAHLHSLASDNALTEPFSVMAEEDV